MGNICCQMKRAKREPSNQVMPVEEYEYSNVFFLGDLEEENKIFIYNS